MTGLGQVALISAIAIVGGAVGLGIGGTPGYTMLYHWCSDSFICWYLVVVFVIIPGALVGEMLGAWIALALSRRPHAMATAWSVAGITSCSIAALFVLPDYVITGIPWGRFGMLAFLVLPPMVVLPAVVWHLNRTWQPIPPP
jgi:hypothetical protein